MALTGVTHSRKLPPSRLLAILPPMLHLTIPVRLLPRPRLGDLDLFSEYNIMLGLLDDNENKMPQTMWKM